MCLWITCFSQEPFFLLKYSNMKKGEDKKQEKKELSQEKKKVVFWFLAVIILLILLGVFMYFFGDRKVGQMWQRPEPEKELTEEEEMEQLLEDLTAPSLEQREAEEDPAAPETEQEDMEAIIDSLTAPEN